MSDDATPESPYVAFDDAPAAAASDGAPLSTPPPKQQPAVRFGGERERWSGTSEVVRDLHRSLLNPAKDTIPSSKSAEGMRLERGYRLHPDVGTASELAQPGGFRRAHLSGGVPTVMEDGSSAQAGRRSSHSSYSATPLLVTLQRTGFFDNFITEAVQALDDGTEIIFQSRSYRRGARPRIVRAASREDLLPSYADQASKLRFVGFRPKSVPWWSTVLFFVGALLFTEGSFGWFAVGDAAAPLFTVTWPYFVGACNFLIGCYLAFVEVINANLSEDLATGALKPTGSIHRESAKASLMRHPLFALTTAGSGGRESGRESGSSGSSALSVKQPEKNETCYAFLRRLHWWRFQPHSLLWWGALVQLIGACLFQVACYSALPVSGVEGLAGEAIWIYAPSLLGSLAFTFASYVYLLEVAADPRNPWVPPKTGIRDWLGYAVALCNLVGSILFSIASLCYFARDELVGRMPLPPPPLAHPAGGGSAATALDAAAAAAAADARTISRPEAWEFWTDMFGVRFCYGVGSLAFAVGAVLNFPELLSDD